MLDRLLSEFPFKEIRSVEVDGQSMVFFPKTYVKIEGTGGAGTIWKFSDTKKEGYHLHHAFYKFNSAGEEVDTGVLHSAYVASQDSDGKPVSNGGAHWGNLTYQQCREKAKLLGSNWDMLNIWDYHFRGMLMLMETLATGYTSADVQTALGGTDGSMGVGHFGISNIWGGSDKGFWIYGLDTSNTLGIANTNIHILGKHGTMVDTGLTPPGSGYPVTFQTKSADEYNLGDLLLGATVTKTANLGSCGDAQDIVSGGAFYTAWGGGRANCGPFYMNIYSPASAISGLSFALRKAV